MRFLVKASVLNASDTRWPLIKSSTSRAFCGDTRWNRAVAVNSIALSLRSKKLYAELLGRRGRCRPCRCFRCRLHGVTLERPRQAEFAKFVADHVFRHIHRNKLPAI